MMHKPNVTDNFLWEASDLLRSSSLSPSDVWHILVSLLFLHFAEIRSDRDSLQVAQSESTESKSNYEVPNEAKLSQLESDPREFAKRVENAIALFAETNNLQDVMNTKIQEIESDILTRLISLLRRVDTFEFRNLAELYGRISRLSKGEFVTPPAVSELMARLVSPKEDDVIGDPAVGSGTLLFAAKRFSLKKDDNNQLWGADINPLALLLSHFQALILNAQDIEFHLMDSLRALGKHSESIGKPALLPDSLDVIVTNPPFGLRIDDPDLIQEFASRKGITSPKLTKHVQIEILFLNLCVELLKPGGKLAILLPEGFLHSHSLRYARDWLIDHVQIKALVSLPPSALPYTGIPTSILVLRKWKKDEVEVTDYPIYMVQVDKLEEELNTVIERFNEKVGWHG